MPKTQFQHKPSQHQIECDILEEYLSEQLIRTRSRLQMQKSLEPIVTFSRNAKLGHKTSPDANPKSNLKKHTKYLITCTLDYQMPVSQTDQMV